MGVGLVGCVKTKQQVPAPAAELYISPLFRGRRAALEASCVRWDLLSAQHGLVAPDQVLEHYDAVMAAAPVSERRPWAARVLAELCDRLGTLRTPIRTPRRSCVHRLRAAGATVELPVAGLGLGGAAGLIRSFEAGGTCASPGLPAAGEVTGGEWRDSSADKSFQLLRARWDVTSTATRQRC